MKKRRTFTLLELLIVVAIMMMLISILMPALRSARERAMETVCKTNLKQSMCLLTIYSGDYNGFLLATYNGTYFWPEVLCRMDYLKWPKIGESSVLICPGFAPKVYTPVGGRFYTTYGLWIGNSKYGAVSGYAMHFCIRLSKMENNRIVLADSNTSGTYPDGLQNYYLDSGNGTELITGSLRTVHVRHSGHKAAHAAFPDGSSRSVTSDWLVEDARYYWRR